MMTKGWIDYMMRLAEHVATKSKDVSTKVGCILVAPDMSIRSTGFNGFPRGCDDSVELYANRDIKLMRTAHAEINAIAQSAKAGTSTDGCYAVVTYPPCSQCAAALINAGIVKVICPPLPVDSKWIASFDESSRMFKEAGVELILVPQ